MKKYFSAFFLLLFFCVSVGAQKKFHAYAVGFYNLENLFDTCHDAGKNDYQFLPSGSYKWNGMKYSHKLHNMARALGDMGTTMLPGVGCSAIGVSEVENDRCLTDLCAQPEPASADTSSAMSRVPTAVASTAPLSTIRRSSPSRLIGSTLMCPPRSKTRSSAPVASLP